MRTLFCTALAAAALVAGSAAADEAPKQERVYALSAEARATPAAYHGPTVGHGYTARQRRIADCLASHANYDPKTDRIRVAPGVRRRCSL